MKHKLSIILFASIIIIISSSVALAINYAFNPGFEDDINPVDGWPDGWNGWTGPNGNWEFVNDAAGARNGGLVFQGIWR